jgi:PAS domain S-box-containing protein
MNENSESALSFGLEGITSISDWMFESSPDCVKLLNRDGQMLAMNRNGIDAMEIEDFSRLRGIDWHSLWPKESHADIRSAVDMAKSGATGHFYAFCPTAKGTPKWWDVVVTPVRNDAGQIENLLSVSRDVTALRQAEDDRIRLVTQKQLALDAAELGAWHLDPATMTLTSDSRFRFIFGVEADELDYETALLAIHPDDRNLVRAAVNGAIDPDDAKPYDIEYRVIHADDSLRWVRAKGRKNVTRSERVLVSFDGTVADITELKRAEQERNALVNELRAANDRMTDIFQRAPAFMCVLRGPDHVFELANDRYLELVSRPNLIGKTMRQALPEIEGQGFFELLDNVYKTGEPFSGSNLRVLLQRNAGQELEERFVDFVYLPLRDATESVSGILIHGVDLTQRIHAENALERVAAELSEADQRKNEFLATLAHELRNPLAPIRNGLHVLRLAADSPGQIAKVREMIERQVAQLVRLVDDLLDVARISSGKIELKKEQVELKKVVLQAVETNLPIIEANHHRLEVAITEEPVFLTVDPARIAQVLANLLNNAAKYTPTGGRIHLSAHRDGDKAVFSVTDTGVGIPPEAFATVFHLFSQVRSETDRAQGGLGIGLSLVRRLVEMHGGIVSVASPGINMGSTFTVYLPLIDTENVDSTFRIDDGIPSPAVRSKKFRVMVVDDNADAADSLASLLEILGHTTRTAHDGHSALQLADDFRPDVAFLDIELPGLNGYELAEKLRRTAGMENILLIALTGWGASADQMRSHNAGFDSHLTKPANLDTVERLFTQGKRFLR